METREYKGKTYRRLEVGTLIEREKGDCFDYKQSTDLTLTACEADEGYKAQGVGSYRYWRPVESDPKVEIVEFKDKTYRKIEKEDGRRQDVDLCRRKIGKLELCTGRQDTQYGDYEYFRPVDLDLTPPPDGMIKHLASARVTVDDYSYEDLVRYLESVKGTEQC